MVIMGSLSLYNCMYIFVFIIMLNIWINKKFFFIYQQLGIKFM